MSVNSNRATLSLLNMIKEMHRKGIENRRIVKTSTLLLMSGLTKDDIPSDIVNDCLRFQKDDGGYIGNTDTLWSVKFLSFYPEYFAERERAIKWLSEGNGIEPGYGRSKRDMHRIPVTGLLLYLLPELGDEKTLQWLEKTWLSEVNSLTYKAAYTMLAFSSCDYVPKTNSLIEDTLEWLSTQQEDNGGFGPWKGHPVGANVYCTSVALLALLIFGKECYYDSIKKGYEYLCKTQLRSGIWPYHEIEDGASWGLLALTQIERYMEDML